MTLRLLSTVTQIMYPRDHRPDMGAGAFKGLVGFVSFMRREDAEYAMQHADGAKWESNGATLSTSWGKVMPKPSRALYRGSHGLNSRLTSVLMAAARSTI